MATALADIDQMKARLVEKEQELIARDLAITAKDHQIAHLTKMLLARKSERLADAKHPLLPFPGDEPAPPPPPHVEEAADDEYEEVSFQRKKRGAPRISKDLPREVRTIALPEADRKCPCCNAPMHKIGEECSERLEALRPHVLPKSPMGDAIGYALRQWSPLKRFLDDGLVAIDNNRVERQMRTVAVGRKKWMFAGSVEGGHRAATIYSLVCTCGLLGIEPWAYLKDVLQRLAKGSDPALLTPRIWNAARTTPA